MKNKIIGLFIFIFMLFPINILAKDGIKNYFIDTTILSNGDIHVKEYFELEGKFNGYERIIYYKGGNDVVYDGDDIELIKIMSVDAKLINKHSDIDKVLTSGKEFDKVSIANKGDYGVYQEQHGEVGYKYNIYNPSNLEQKGFYLEYVIKNLGIVYEDIAQIGWNIFSYNQTEFIKNLEMYVHIPGNQNELRVWGHGPLFGGTEIISKTKIKYFVDNLKENTPIDIRMLFDKEVIKDSNKIQVTKIFDQVIAEETAKANLANEERQKQEKTNKSLKSFFTVFTIFNICYVIYILINIRKIYYKYDKENVSEFKGKYFRDFPAKYGPEIVNYLFKQNIDSKDLSNSLLNLIADKFITFETGKKKEYILIKESTEDKRKLTESEEWLLTWFFEKIGFNNKVTIKQINSKAKKSYNSFLSNYNKWKSLALKEARNEKFYENINKGKNQGKKIAYIGIGIYVFYYFLSVYFSFFIFSIINLTILITSMILLIYSYLISKKTEKGINDYYKWQGLKKFINDFGSFDKKELPQIMLWEKYLVYANVFGLSKKLQKSMKIKFEELDVENSISNNLINLHYFHHLNVMSRVINTNVSNSVNVATTTKYSTNYGGRSSGGGFSGGFSSGGGSFGGGGGGGRF